MVGNLDIRDDVTPTRIQKGYVIQVLGLSYK